MLYLGGGMRQVKVSDHQTLYVFPDFSDPGQFYYLPNLPHVAKMEDGTPAIRMLVYREDLEAIDEDDPEAVAFVSLDVDLAWPPDVIDRAASKIRTEDALPGKPRLTPIFFSKGSVKLMLLDAITAEETGGGTPTDRTDFVTQIMGAASPSLYGDNRAIFQASLSKKGAAALSGALDGVTPIGVVYSLTFAGLQPAFRVKARVDWQKVYDHFSEREQTDLLFYEKDVQRSIDTLIDERTIVVDVTQEGIGAEGMESERQQVTDLVRQLIFDKFFEATFKRVDPAGGGTADDVVDTLTSLAQNSLTLGVGYTYHRKEVRIEELRSLDIDWTARKAAERTIYPQAHMHNLLTGASITESQLIRIVDAADPLWKVLPFEIAAAAAWEPDGIAGITVDVEYEDANGTARSMSTFLDKTKSKVIKREWMDRAGGDGFRYRYEVVFTDGGVAGPRSKVASPWIDQTGTILVITPSDLYETVDLDVAPVSGFPFARWPAVQVIVRYRTEDGSFEHTVDGVLSEAKKDLKARFRIDRGVPGTREIQVTYLGVTGERVDRPWVPMPTDQFVVDDPHAERLVVRAVVSGDRQNIANLLVDLEYHDDGNDIHESGNLAFDTTNIDQALSWPVSVAPDGPRRFRYRMTLVTRDGEFLQTGWISTDSPTIPVGEVYVRRLGVELVTGDLGRNVEAVEVALAYEDVPNEVHAAETFRLGPNSRAEWQVQLKDASKRAYQMTTTWIQTDGFNPKIGPTSTSDTFVVLPGAPPR